MMSTSLRANVAHVHVAFVYIVNDTSHVLFHCCHHNAKSYEGPAFEIRNPFQAHPVISSLVHKIALKSHVIAIQQVG